MRRCELPGPGAQHPLHKVSHREQEQHDEHPGKFPGHHGDVVVGLVHELLATGDRGGVVALRAADLLVPADVLSTSADGGNQSADEKARREEGQRLALVEKHRRCASERRWSR